MILFPIKIWVTPSLEVMFHTLFKPFFFSKHIRIMKPIKLTPSPQFSDFQEIWIQKINKYIQISFLSNKLPNLKVENPTIDPIDHERICKKKKKKPKNPNRSSHKFQMHFHHLTRNIFLGNNTRNGANCHKY